MFQRTDAALSAIIIQRIPTAILREGLRCADTRRTSAEHFFHRLILGYRDVVLLQRLRQRQTEHVFHVAVQQTCSVQLAEDPQYATGTMNIFHMVFLRARRNLTQLRHFTGQLVDVAHGEVDFRFLRRRQQMQNGIG